MAPAAPLPQPMLARSGSIPTRGDWSFEVKWDGFRALVSTEGSLRVHSRRGWDMAALVPELAGLGVPAKLDGELVAFGPDGCPDFPLVCERMLMRRDSVAIVFVIFDLLSLNGRDRLEELERQRERRVRKAERRARAANRRRVT